jgi:MoaA/NifB/PqqE/SkfB family radical SAM enzyme
MVLMTSNYATVQRMVDLAADLGAGGVTFLQMLPIGAGAQLHSEMLTDPAATHLLTELQVPEGLRIRLRTRTSAGRFTVIRADGLASGEPPQLRPEIQQP